MTEINTMNGIFEIYDNGEYMEITNAWDENPLVYTEPIFDNDLKSWKVVLRINPLSNYFVEALDSISYRTPEEKASKGENHTGHLIAQEFYKYLLTNAEIEIHHQSKNNFFGDNNAENTEYQSPRANLNSLDYPGQKRFEDEIFTFLKNNEDAYGVYYEIELVKDENNMLMGRRIYYQAYIGTSDDDKIALGAPVHAFIRE